MPVIRVLLGMIEDRSESVSLLVQRDPVHCTQGQARLSGFSPRLAALSAFFAEARVRHFGVITTGDGSGCPRQLGKPEDCRPGPGNASLSMGPGSPPTHLSHSHK
eukprot:757976-Hanusia_phi.AAC.1